MRTLRLPLNIMFWFLTSYAISFPANAEIYQCKDPATGNMSFSDTACPDKSHGTAIRVAPTNSSDAFASQYEIAESQRKRAIEQSTFKKDWQDHNASVQKQERTEKALRKEEMEKKQNQWDNRYKGSRRYYTTRPGRASGN